VAECKSALGAAARELARISALREKNVASESELDETDARHRAATAKNNVALAEVTRREAALKAAFVRLSYTQIRTAWDDSNEIRTVGERYVDQGEMLSPNEPIVSIIDNTVVIALIDVIERDYPKLSVGQPVTLTTDAFPDRVFSGEVVRISPLLREVSRQARVEIEIPNPECLLKPGMYVRAEIELARHDSVTVVPVSALARRDDLTGVFIADTTEMKARFTEIEPGITDGKVVEVTTPELSGSVITMGHHLLEDGGSILLPEVESSRPAGGKGPGGRP
jgi:RND family efflux transporter MFP subunit